ncbi:uncharacterized protein PAC_10117 [Phialocephala subalpina]|uniref:Uncharacterized protein n=1 Tax=Phialocephala subalpina TaxID=576137 RepID=A0A1L7X5B8_9HELO|nr:uncharacterized protein PAC_10117 [Phialocephala subalpina]
MASNIAQSASGSTPPRNLRKNPKCRTRKPTGINGSTAQAYEPEENSEKASAAGQALNLASLRHTTTRAQKRKLEAELQESGQRKQELKQEHEALLAENAALRLQLLRVRFRTTILDSESAALTGELAFLMEQHTKRQAAAAQAALSAQQQS